MAPKTRKFPPGKAIVPWTAAQNREFLAIRKRATALSGKLTDADFDAKGNPVGRWAKILDDLERWAKKYKVKLETHEHDHGAEAGGAPAGATPYSAGYCPATTTSTEVFDLQNGGKYTFNYECTLKRKGLFGRCIYRCVSSGFSLT
ncbi:MAG: hypothetical protein U1F37_22270 [Alphaproteobacteria bacterium]